jgi:hypothetical protein
MSPFGFEILIILAIVLAVALRPGARPHPVLILFNTLCLILTLLVLTVSLIGIPLVALYISLTFAGAEKRAKTARDKLAMTLMPGETPITSGIQQRIHALSHRRHLVAITPSRVILIQRGILGGFTMQDFQWKDIQDAEMAENIIPALFGSRLSFQTPTGYLVIDGVPSAVAPPFYQIAQTKEQEWKEKNRVRMMDETRARSGATVVNVGTSSAATSGDVATRITKFKELLDQGTITDSEFQEIKAKILSGQLV